MYRIERINKVKNAMLGMQRESWEQGVAAQALLELGDKTWVILLAKAAVVRQGEDGRLGLSFAQFVVQLHEFHNITYGIG